MINNKELAPLKKKVVNLAEEAEKFVIKTPAHMSGAVELLSALNKLGDAIKEKKETITKPLNEALKNARALFKPLETPYDEAIETMRSKMTAYQTMKVNAEKAEALKIANRVGEGSGKYTLETAVSKIEAIEKTDKTISTDIGAVNFRTVKRFEVVDLASVPREYLMIDEKLVKKAMEDDKVISGIKYFEEQIPVNYR